MEGDIKQRTQKHRRRERAARMQMQKEQDRIEQLSEEDECRDNQIRQVQRPPIRKKRNKEPLYDEDVIDGFSILSFKTYEDLESSVKGERNSSSSRRAAVSKLGPRFSSPANHLLPPDTRLKVSVTPPPPPVNGSSPARRQEDSKPLARTALPSPPPPPPLNGVKEHLSDASSRASSGGGGYMCDAESEDDKASDACSDLFKATTLKRELPLSIYNYRSPSPLQNGHLELPLSPTEPPSSALPSVNSFLSPKSNFLTKAEPRSSPQPPPSVVPAITSATTTTITTCSSSSPSSLSSKCYVDNGPLNFAAQPPLYPLKASPVTAAPAPEPQPPPLASQGAVKPPRYTPEPHRLRYTPPKPSVPVASPAPLPRGDSSNSSISSLSQLSHSLQGKSASRSSSRNNTPLSVPGPYGPPSSSLVFGKTSWLSANPLLSSSSSVRAVPPPPPPILPLPATLHTPGATLHASGLHHPGPASMFASPLPPPAVPTSAADPLFSQAAAAATSNLIKISQSGKDPQDLLRRELDSRFLASQDRSLPIPPPPYLRSELHPQSFLPPPNPTHLYDKFPKMDSYYSRSSALGLPGYPLLPPPTGTTPFVSPNHLAAFQPKIGNLVKNKTTKCGKWCAMHVRIAWEIYHFQQNLQGAEKKSADLLRQPLFPPARQHNLPPPFPTPGTNPLHLASTAPPHPRLPPPFENSPATSSFLSSHLGLSPFATRFSGFGASSYGGLGSLGLPPGPGPSPLFAAPPSQDPWPSRLHFPWAGINHRPPAPTSAKEELKAREKLREQERQKERERESRLYHHHHHHLHSSAAADSLCNGDRAREKSRSPHRTPHHHLTKNGSAFASTPPPPRVKEERKEDPSPPRPRLLDRPSYWPTSSAGELGGYLGMLPGYSMADPARSKSYLPPYPPHGFFHSPYLPAKTKPAAPPPLIPSQTPPR